MGECCIQLFECFSRKVLYKNQLIYHLVLFTVSGKLKLHLSSTIIFILELISPQINAHYVIIQRT